MGRKPRKSLSPKKVEPEEVIEQETVACPSIKEAVAWPSTSKDRVTTTVGNLCFFSCPFCDGCRNKRYLSWPLMRHHLERRHRGRIATAAECSARPKVMHLCMECAKQIPADVTVLTAHLRARHEMRLREYVEKHRPELVGAAAAERPRRFGQKRPLRGIRSHE